MNFVTRTRVVQYADLVGNVEKPLDTPVVVKTFPVGIIYQTITDANNSLPVNQRIDPTDFWKYRLEWLVQSYLIPHIRGLRTDIFDQVQQPDGSILLVQNHKRLVFDVDFWPDQATHDAGNPASRQNTFSYGIGDLSKTDFQAQLTAMIDDYLIGAELKNFVADDRDLNIPTTTNPLFDTLGILAKPAVLGADNTPRTLNPMWRTF